MVNPEKTKRNEIDFRQRLLIILDIETTGLDPDKHEIIEIGCLVVDPQTLEVIAEYSSKVQPKHLETADPQALEINKFSLEAWKEAKPLGEVMREFNMFAPGGVPAGFNVSFDRGFIEKAAREEEVELTIDYHWVDVMSLVYEGLFSDKRFEGLEKLGLTHVCEVLGISHREAHTAMGDARATLEVYRCLRKAAISESLAG